MHQGLVQVDDYADLVRVLGLGLGEQVLDWGVLWGWVGLAAGTSLKPQSFLLHMSSLPQPSTWRATRTVGETNPFPALPLPTLEPGVGRLALWASLPDLGNQGRGKLPLLKGKFRIPMVGGPSLGRQSWGIQGWEGLGGWRAWWGDRGAPPSFQGLRAGHEEPPPPKPPEG